MISATPVSFTRFSNLTDAMLADEMGAIDAALDAAKARQDEARDEMTRRGRWAIEGETFTVAKTSTATSSIDTAGIRTEMGGEWVKAHMKAGTRINYRVGRKGGPAVAPAAAPAPAPALAAAEAAPKPRRTRAPKAAPPKELAA